MSDSPTKRFFPQDIVATGIHQRKRDHIALCHTGDVGLEGDPGLWNQVRLMHCALPELKGSDIDLSTTMLGRIFKVPVMATGMTGGPPEAGEINRALAKLCEDFGMPFGVGSQRVMTKDLGTLDTFKVRTVAPNVFLLANLGVNQLRDLGVQRAKELVDMIEADALAIHLNPAMEVVQPDPDADVDFHGGYEAIAKAVEAMDGKVLVKECGCGLSPMVLKRLYDVGVQAVDLSGVGGTSWVKLEALRAGGSQAQLGFTLAEWGIPTTAATLMAHQLRMTFPPDQDFTLVASGGIQDPLHAVKALALGADCVGLARPLLQALLNEGEEGARAYLKALIDGIRHICLLTGSKNLKALKECPKVIGPTLDAWGTLSLSSAASR